jgi:hypothetical protein
MPFAGSSQPSMSTDKCVTVRAVRDARQAPARRSLALRMYEPETAAPRGSGPSRSSSATSARQHEGRGTASLRSIEGPEAYVTG